MEGNSENLRRSSRLKTRVNYCVNEDEIYTKQLDTPGTSRQGKSTNNSNFYDDSTAMSTKTIPVKVTRRRGRNNSATNFDDVPEKNILMDELEKELNDIEVEVQKPKELFHDNDISGNRIYGFQTPLKKNAMAQKALLSRTPNICKNISKIMANNKVLRVVMEKVDVAQSTTPILKHKKSVKINEIPITRKRHIHYPSESESVSEDSEYVPSNSDESDDNTEDDVKSDVENESDVNGTLAKSNRHYQMRKIQIPITPCRRGRSKNHIVYRDYHLKTDEYFESQASKPLTSDHTLGRLKNPRLNEEKLQELLCNNDYMSNIHKKGIRTLTENYKSMFPMWHHIMEEGFSVLLYGLGSKRHLIDAFHKEVIINHPTVIINGFFPSLTIKDILDSIITELLKLNCPTNVNECVDIIENILNDNPDDRLYLLIHNIDGAMLRTNKSQDVLSRLAAIPNIHVLASADHINAPIIWDNVKRSRYNFYWCDVTTLLPYQAETSYESSLLVQHTGALALSSLNNVFASLTTNAKAIYTILVKYQLDNGKNNIYPGMAFKDLYRIARENFLVSSDIALRAQLTEFIDHKLVRAKRNIDGIEYLIISLDNSLLQKFIDDQQTY